MRTYTHGLLGWLLYLKGSKQQQKLAAAGAMLPDAILVLGFIFHFTGDWSFGEWLHEWLHHSALHTLTVAMHSAVLVGLLLLGSYVFWKKMLPLFVGMFSHMVLDFLTHQQWGYNHLYPFDAPILTAPISYTGTWFTAAEHIFFVGVIVWLFVRNRKPE